MKKSIIKTFLLLGLIALLAFGFSCKKKNGKDEGKPGGSEQDGATTYTITYVLNGGTNADNAVASYTSDKAVPLPTPTKENNTFEGWFENADFSGNKVNAITKGSSGNKTFYAKWAEKQSQAYKPKWDLNKIDFDGNEMKIVIKVLPVSEYDPFDADYTGENKAIKQQHQSLVEQAYNVRIEYSAWDNEAPWGPDRVKFIKESYIDGSFKNKGVYVVTLSSQWVPTLVKAQCLAPLYDSASQTGIFANAGYNQDSTVSEAVAVNKVVYGYSQGAARPDYFMYYNATLAAQCGLEDPATLWFKGEWNVAKFDELVKKAQSALGAGQYAIDCSYAVYAIGAVAGRGNKMVDTSRGKVLFTRQTVTSVFDEMKAYYKNGYWDKGHGVQDVAQNFINGNTVFHTGSLWFLKESTRFDPNTVAFEIGMVPYPMANDSVATPITEPYTYQDTEGNEVRVDEPLKDRNDNVIKDASGNDIYGVDLSASSFLMPYTGTSNYSIMNITNGANGITPEVVFNILYDLVGGQGDDPNKDAMTSDEGYRIYLETKLDSAIYVDVVMSVQDPSLSYYEVMETLSMTVGDGSHFGPNAFWPLCSGMMTSEDTPATKLKEVLDIYQAALESLGY